MIISLRPLIFRLAVPICGLLALSFFGFIYIKYPNLYFLVMRGVIKIPAPHPFVDWEYIPSAVRCYSEGVDVYIDNTCFTVWPDPQPFPYSPLLLRATFLRAGEHWTNAIMVSVCVLFCLFLATLPPPHDRRNLFITLFGTLSCATFLGAERGNADLILFLMIVSGVHLRVWPLAFRLGGYGLIMLAGLVKFYPFVALIVTLREGRFVIAVVAVVSMAALATLLLCDHELALMLANLPAPSYFVLQFGAANLPGGIGVSVGKVMEKLGYMDADTARATAAIVSSAILPILVISTITVAYVIGRGCRLRLILTTLPTRQLYLLVTGAALICGCFFAGQSVIYRGIYLLLALPGLAELSRLMPTPVGRRLFTSAGPIIVFVLWTPFLDQCLKLGGLTEGLNYIGWAKPIAFSYHANNYDNFKHFTWGYVLWLAGELAWWWIIILLLAVVGAFVGITEMWTQFCRLPRCLPWARGSVSAPPSSLTASLIGNSCYFADGRIATGHLGRVLARATIRRLRTVIIELGMRRSGRIGGASGSITLGNGKSRER